MGDLRSLRWVLASEIRKGSLPYLPIVGLDEMQRKHYVACLSSPEGHSRSRPYCLLLCEDFLLTKGPHLKEWQRLRRYGSEPEVYVLAARDLSGIKNTPRVYWASPSWNYRLCSCSYLNCRYGDPSYSITHSRSLHIPEAIPDTRLVNAVTLEKIFIKSGSMMEVEILSWFAGGPTLFFRNGRWCWFDSVTG
ncbi:hypothetical protein NEOLEDRAFT_215195 [Neolentinus lepideus HHB14362 ss-1]|uniref:Uncharacterized protein n=1 Tax=Neolentinus lepideus HHB14362 ss-1 TaxID=1314782 RepID=A0A165MD09_9AGAM|nr:hypothetical protein NEOLEDRAFT_215195 [Neolentinus lepideus HHB14362 ss-1]